MNSIPLNSSIVSEAYSSRRIARFENHPAMPALLKELPPRAAASLFHEVGIADAGVLMAMMPARALLLAFDESIWKSPKPHLPEKISAPDLVDWLEAWIDIGERFLVEKLDAMSDDYLTSLLSRIVIVESHSRYAVYGEHFDAFVELCEDGRERFGPYIVESNVNDGVDVVREVVRALWNSDAPKFLRLFGRLADLPDPVDSTRGSAATLHDIEFEREAFRESRGFVTAEGARAFFAYAGRLSADEIMTLNDYDAETQRYLDAIARAAQPPDTTSGPVIADGLEDI